MSQLDINDKESWFRWLEKKRQQIKWDRYEKDEMAKKDERNEQMRLWGTVEMDENTLGRMRGMIKGDSLYSRNRWDCKIEWENEEKWVVDLDEVVGKVERF
jgi:hypothetical protein